MAELTLVHVQGEGAQAIGYGRLGVKLADALTAQGVDVYDDIAAPQDRNHLTDQVDGKRHKRTNVACWVSTPGHARGWWEGQHVGLFSMWEATRLPEAYTEYLYAFDTVVVPSEHNVELFSNFHSNVRLAYLGVDPEQWHYVPRSPPARDFYFLIGGSGPRKGTDLAVKAFRKVFPEGSWGSGPVPRLIMKSPKGEDFYGDRIEVISGRISALDEVELYEMAHCYLQPSRGEGFGLQPLQALAQGIPTILTDAHGHAAFAHLGYPLSTTMSKAGYFIYGEPGDWWEPSLDELCTWMEFVYQHYDECCEEAKDSAAIVARDFTWANTAEQFLAAFDGELERPYRGDGTWHKPEVKLYPIKVRIPFKADVAGCSYQWMPRETYYESADVLRILYEAQILDPSCLADNEDNGLTESQAARLGHYSARNAYCITCGQRLNSEPTRAQDLMAARA